MTKVRDSEIIEHLKKHGGELIDGVKKDTPTISKIKRRCIKQNKEGGRIENSDNDTR